MGNRRNENEDRAYDLVLWGASGFTGALVAEYLSRHPEAPEMRIALGGRNREKLETVRAALPTEVGRAFEVVIGDSGDPASMEALASSARVICSTVGPYARRGSNLVAACAAFGTDYCDITGEVHWARRMIDAHDETARRSGAHILHFCGYDSLPSDLGTWMLHRHLVDEHQGRLRSVRHVFTRLSGGMSGGSLSTMVELFEDMAGDPGIARIAANPYALYPASAAPGHDGRDRLGVGFDRRLGSFTAPFIMASINSRVVRWTNATLGFPYGENFRYDEMMGTGRGLFGAARAIGVSAGLAGFGAGLAVPAVRRALVRHVLPAPGEGPSAEEREAGSFESVLLGEGVDAEGRSVRVRGVVAGDRDPGYAETAKMLAECALCLSRGDHDADSEPGVRSPAATIATVLIERLREAGIRFEVSTERVVE